MTDISKYRTHSDLKILMKSAGLTPKDFVNILILSPSAIYNQLNGVAPLSPENAAKIKSLCQSQIKKIQERKKLNEKEELSFADAGIALDKKSRISQARKYFERQKELAAQAAKTLAALESGDFQGKE
jgi:transcriptional regulator with XRE-family HTH domain